jgi:hypothetical protein
VAGFEDTASTELAEALPDAASQSFTRRGGIGRTKRLMRLLGNHADPPLEDETWFEHDNVFLLGHGDY